MFNCDHCGACCKGSLLVEVFHVDVLREPQLATADVGRWTLRMAYQEVMAELEGGEKVLHIAAVDSPCRFLDANDECRIYPTRPNVCVAMQAGDEQCQQARDYEGLPPLPPSDG